MAIAQDAGSASRKRGCPDDALGHVRVVDATHCVVPRAVFFGDHDCVLARPRLSAVVEEGRTLGFRQHDVPSRSVYARCGLRSGDVWLRLNGSALDSPEAALALYPSLRQQRELDVEVQRDGQLLRFSVELVD